MQSTLSSAQLELSQSAILHNYKYFRSLLDNSTKMLVLVKANAYGHGDVEIAKLMEKAGADYLAVAFSFEGLELRAHGIKSPIMVLSGNAEAYPEIIDHNLEASIPDMLALTRWRDTLRKKGLKGYPTHIKLDTGMHRLGFCEDSIDELISFIKESPEIKIQSVFSHLAASDDSVHDHFTLEQIALYDKLSTKITESLDYKPIRHILNSAGIERFTKYQFDMVRLGIGLYGFSAVDQSAMKTCAFLRCPILQIKDLTDKDGTVGYGRHGKLLNSINKIATIGIGYADGVNRHFGRGKVAFEVNGQLAPTIGDICMDMCMLDITGIDAQVGDTVTIFGEKPTVKQLAKLLDTIPYEIFTPIPQRVKRVLID